MQHNDTSMGGQGELALSEAAERHCELVRGHLQQLIAAADGFLTFERYMNAVLYAPGLGYYSGGAEKLGAGGDFFTAPELSRLFGACVAVQCAQILPHLESGVILEVGAGTGRLAADVLTRLDQAHQLPAQYRILEVSADLRDRQRRFLTQSAPQYLDLIRWIDAPPEDEYEGIVIGNEVLDALPAARFRWYPDRVEELGVQYREQQWVSAARPAPAIMTEDCRILERDAGGWDPGYVSEYCPQLIDWTRAVTRSLSRGAALWIDYGLPRAQYYLRERHEGTLLCHFRHRAHDDPFFFPGLQDITAWVDFTRLAEASRECAFDLAGFTTQAHFLAGCGIDQEMHRLAGDNQKAFARLASEARQLMLPGEMGERFKAMGWLRGLDLALCGFALRDLRPSLG
jgi:SAM-dependent MidA family methyltransferase